MNSQNLNELYKKIKTLLAYSVKAAQYKLVKRPGSFELLGCDIMIDDQMNPILIEFNTNPALGIDTSGQQEIIPYVIQTTLDIIFKLQDNISKLDKLLKEEKFTYFQTYTILINQATNFIFQ